MRKHDSDSDSERDTFERDTFERGARLLGRLSGEGVRPPWETFADVAPVLGHEVGHAFGVVMSRPGLDLKTRELTTVCMLAVLGGCEPQVAFHVGGALRAGATAAEVVEALTQVSVYAGIPRALNAVAAARQVFVEHGVSAIVEAPRAVVVSFVDSVTRGDRAAALTLLAADVTWKMPGQRDGLPWAGTWHGHLGVTEFQSLLDTEMQVERFALREPVTAGDVVYVPGSIAFRCPRRGIAHDGDFIMEFTVRDGRIVALRVHTDS